MLNPFGYLLLEFCEVVLKGYGHVVPDDKGPVLPYRVPKVRPSRKLANYNGTVDPEGRSKTFLPILKFDVRCRYR
jgi:hypothetical protein